MIRRVAGPAVGMASNEEQRLDVRGVNLYLFAIHGGATLGDLEGPHQ
jgi:hypothetical protein